MTTPDFVQVVTTTGSRELADTLARSAIDRRLAACAQIAGPITSVYRWAGQLEQSTEWTVTFKTAAYEPLAAHIVSEHDYDVPEIIATPIVAGPPDYLDWIAEHSRTHDAP